MFGGSCHLWEVCALLDEDDVFQSPQGPPNINCLAMLKMMDLGDSNDLSVLSLLSLAN